MTSSTSPKPPRAPLEEVWLSCVSYITPSCAAAVAILPVFRDFIAKSAQQKGVPIPKLSLFEGLKSGLRAAPTIGCIVGGQIALQSVLDKFFTGKANSKTLPSLLASSAVVGVVSAPALAIFNGQTMGLSLRASIHKFSPKQGMAIALREAAFIGGIGGANVLADTMKRVFGDHKVVDCTAAFAAGALGSLIGHPADTVLTRLQGGLPVEKLSQLMWGAARKARATGLFSIGYRFVNDLLQSKFQNLGGENG